MPRLIRCSTQLPEDWRREEYGEVELLRPTRYPRATLHDLAWEGTRVVHYWLAEDGE